MPIVVNINSGTDYEPVSEGVHSAVLADIIDLGKVQTAFGEKDKVRFVWLTDEADENGRTKRISKSYTKSLHEKANLRKDVEKIIGKPLGSATSFDVERLIGAQNQLVVEHNEGTDGKVYGNVKAIMKPKEKIAIPADFERKTGGKAIAAAVLSPAKNAHGVAVTNDDLGF